MDADTLRYILIVVGAILILALYLWERGHEPRQPGHQNEQEMPPSKREPSLGELEEGADGLGAPTDTADAADDSFDAAESAARSEPLLIQLGVVAADVHFAGTELLQTAARCGLEPGDMDIFHSSGADRGGSFSMANMVKPGTFPFDAMEDFESPGLMLFAQLDGGPGGMELLDEMLAAARQLATALGGDVLDETRNPLSVKKEEILRARIIEHELQTAYR